MEWLSAKDLPDARDDGVCAECVQKPAITTDGRYCRKCLKTLVKQLSPGVTRNYVTGRGADGCHQGNVILDRAERHANRDYWALLAEGSQANAVRAMEGD